MKKLIVTLALVLGAAGAHAEEAWKQVGGIFESGTGTQATIPLPAEARFTPPFYTVQPAYVTRFIVRIGPGSMDRGCRLATSADGDVVFTGVLSSQVRLRPTTLVSTELSGARGRQDWTNHIFEVNGGQGAPVQAIQPAFKRGFERRTICSYEVLYIDDGQEVLPRNGGERRLGVAAAPAAARETGAVKIEVKTGEKAQ